MRYNSFLAFYCATRQTTRAAGKLEMLALREQIFLRFNLICKINLFLFIFLSFQHLPQFRKARIISIAFFWPLLLISHYHRLSCNMHSRLWIFPSIIVPFLFVFLNALFGVQASTSSNDLRRRTDNDQLVQPDDPIIQQALIEILKSLKSSDIQSLQFAFTGGVAMNHWFPEDTRPVEASIP